ncbi:2OG-Fe(II) oxygenase superfamily [Thermoactinomyces sp. DSM 45891]|uniref:2OG-Fe(II) oxygenase n=1 Tax=Thermoactinomyces sp. DSM 45891 TaxID=1761907 RepID=UPI00091C356D|nr:2OG-Fe(II) oxygenase [Thermoactinomyces sp. DSM 45891]SFX76049.1 2OG-Fe(II) oxygenase superfamily [Thermoactinomyces sp. DSM 45891]
MSSAQFIEFNEVRKYLYPYPFFRCNEFFNQKTSNMLIDFLENNPYFVGTKGDFYEQTMFPLTEKILSDELIPILDNENRKIILENAEEYFGVKLKKDFFATAHRLLPGQETGIHNDYLETPSNYKYGFTHRIIVYINRVWNHHNGGLLGIYSSDKSEDLVTTIEPIHNTAVGLSFSKTSFHDVSKVLDGERYTVNFSFLALSEL